MTSISHRTLFFFLAGVRGWSEFLFWVELNIVCFLAIQENHFREMTRSPKANLTVSHSYICHGALLLASNVSLHLGALKKVPFCHPNLFMLLFNLWWNLNFQNLICSICGRYRLQYGTLYGFRYITWWIVSPEAAAVCAKMCQTSPVDLDNEGSIIFQQWALIFSFGS